MTDTMTDALTELRDRYPNWHWMPTWGGTHLTAELPDLAVHVDARRLGPGRWVARAFSRWRTPLDARHGTTAVEAVEALVAALEAAPRRTP